MYVTFRVCTHLIFRVCMHLTFRVCMHVTFGNITPHHLRLDIPDIEASVEVLLTSTNFQPRSFSLSHVLTGWEEPCALACI